jgi:hypothetical protein
LVDALPAALVALDAHGMVTRANAVAGETRLFPME